MIVGILFWMNNNLDNTSNEVKTNTVNCNWNGITIALQIFLPIAGLAFFWGRKDLFNRLLLQLDRNCVSVICPSFSKREKLLKWAGERLPLTWSSPRKTLCGGISDLWKDGSLLCTLINTAIPGACPNPHRHWRKPPLHAQAIAYKYLGMVPIFTEEQFSHEINLNYERDFLTYLQELQKAINNLSAKNDSKVKFTCNYIMRGMGLYTGEQHKKSIFYIYKNDHIRKYSDILIYIRGPYGTRGKATVSSFHNKTEAEKAMKSVDLLPFGNNLLKTISLDFTSLINMEEKNKKNEIPIQIEMEKERVKITYIPQNNGVYEINLICNGELLTGSPYIVYITNNIKGIKSDLVKNKHNLTEETKIITKRKIVSKFIDFVNEKIDVNEDKINIQAPKMEKIAEEAEKLAEKEEMENPEDNNKNNALSDIPITDINFNNNFEMNQNTLNSQNELGKKYDKDFTKTKREDDKSLEVAEKLTLTPSICPNHIVPEVKENKKLFHQLSLSERRNKFIRQNFVEKLTSHSSFSDENDEVMTNNKSNQKLTELSVLNVLHSLKQSQNCFNDCNDNEIRINTALSLPNITCLESSHESVFKSRKEYWERMSCCSSSTASINYDTYNDKKIDTKSIDLSNNSDKDEISKSVDDILSIRCDPVIVVGSFKKYKSMDDSLENCTAITIEQRKKMLLKTEYEKQKVVIKKKNINSPKKEIIVKEKVNNNLSYFSSIAERIRKFDGRKIFTTNEIKTTQTIPEIKNNETNTKTDPLLTNEKKVAIKKTLKSHFKRAIKYFKNLEENTKQKTIKTINVERRHSLDYKIQTANKEIKIGGSLNLPNTSEKFSISNLYEDILGNRRSSFKGTPNKQALAEELASFKKTVTNFSNENQRDDKIKFNLFVNNAKRKKRRSIKSLFDVNY